MSIINYQPTQIDNLLLPQGISLATVPNLTQAKGKLAYNITDDKVYVSNGSIFTEVSGSSTLVTLAAVGAVPNANGASITGQVLNLQPASATFPGAVTTGAQTFGGQKTLNNGLLLTNATPSYTPASLDYYETFSTTYSMSGCANVNFVCRFTRIGRMVNLSWETVSGVATTIAGRLTTSSLVPARFLAINISMPMVAIGGPLSISIVTGHIYFLSGGAIEICNNNNTDFAFPGYCGFMAGGISYSV